MVELCKQNKIDHLKLENCKECIGKGCKNVRKRRNAAY